MATFKDIKGPTSLDGADITKLGTIVFPRKSMFGNRFKKANHLAPATTDLPGIKTYDEAVAEERAKINDRLLSESMQRVNAVDPTPSNEEVIRINNSQIASQIAAENRGSLYDQALKRIKALPSYDQRRQMRESLAPGGDNFSGPPAPAGPLSGRIAPVSTPRLDAGPTAVSMSAPSAMHGSEKEAGREYQRATALLHRLSRKGTLAQRADAALAATGLRDKATQHGFNPVGVDSREGSEQEITGRMQARQQGAADMGLFARRNRMIAQRYIDNPAGNTPIGTNPTATEPVITTKTYDFTNNQLPPSFENLTDPFGGYTPIDEAKTQPSPLKTMFGKFMDTGTGLSNSLSKMLGVKSVGDSSIPRFRDGI